MVYDLELFWKANKKPIRLSRTGYNRFYTLHSTKIANSKVYVRILYTLRERKFRKRTLKNLHGE